ncbi:MAG: hypothetical protein ACK4WD_15100 [Flavobacteriales bacterium]|jgi:hypothetical protein
MTNLYYENDQFEMSFDGLIFKTSFKNRVNVTEHLLFDMFEKVSELSHFSTRYCITDLSEVGEISPSVKRIYRDSDTLRSKIADAFVVPSFSMRVIANLYIKLYKPTIPTRVFHSIKEAEQWIEEMKGGFSYNLKLG